jgi:hypothetical protein
VKKNNMQDYSIRKINHGIACRIGNTIYYNYRLEKYPQLLEAILRHEKNHTDGLTREDILMDLQNEEIKPFKKEYYKFVISNPSSLTELLPCAFYDGRLVFNPLVSMLWMITIGVTGIICSKLI